jgi:hypothetical protein
LIIYFLFYIFWKAVRSIDRKFLEYIFSDKPYKMQNAKIKNVIQILGNVWLMACPLWLSICFCIRIVDELHRIFFQSFDLRLDLVRIQIVDWIRTNLFRKYWFSLDDIISRIRFWKINAHKFKNEFNKMPYCKII